ncbi:MAG TPA: hypothetical protein VL996_08140 [Methylocella sp.]|nr:hypothetical protein [Methylocella sp.]
MRSIREATTILLTSDERAEPESQVGIPPADIGAYLLAAFDSGLLNTNSI